MEKSHSFFQKILFLWWLTLPFGAHLLPISLGAFTLYPVFIFSIMGAAAIFLTYQKWDALSKGILLFLTLWCVQGGAQWYLNGYGKTDVRALLMQWLFFTSLLSFYYLLGREVFFKQLVVGLRIFLFVLISAGLVEFYSGCHLQGTFTDKLLDIPVRWVFYAPVFIYDNPNDYLAYTYFLLGILPLFDLVYRRSIFWQMSLTGIVFLFSMTADSRFGEFMGFSMLLFQLAHLIWRKIQKFKWKLFVPYILAFGITSGLLFFHPIFIGPKYKDGAAYRVNEMKILDQQNGQWSVKEVKKHFSNKEVELLTKALDELQRNSPKKSDNLRKNLILNGFSLVQDYPFFGAGPGGFEQFHLQKRAPFFVDTHTSPHNFLIEVVSQYGVIGWVYFFIILLLVYWIVKPLSVPNILKNRYLLLFLMMIVIIWMMPSGYLYLKIHRLLLPCLLVLVLSKKRQFDTLSV
jgi:hypothetical protein